MKKASIIFLILTLFLLFMNFRDSFYGNPISRYLVTRQITNYISDYAHIKNFEITTINKNFKNGGYYIANVYDEDNNNKFIIESTERNVVSHNLDDIKQPINVDETNYSPIILWVALEASFILFAISSIIYFYGALFRKEKKI
ncbi:hypothetical protein JHL18_22435 [Clostridium sp. YIM B02505]|uniref:YfjL-like N-terminal domain-containing protein n=1 Tax=Clostridium yunnanense TaxID=2800325 RepID=A0ABS1EVH0_9CLOT|nr:hypothetical protein [Clostridium yunnanense]MBK1813384.1 hypothetical protein [Clostridium yunnanense]